MPLYCGEAKLLSQQLDMINVKQIVKSVPLIGPLLVDAKRALFGPADCGPFPGVSDYWERRYREGGTSGSGSYGRLALFKAEILNKLIKEYDVTSVIEFGCGDGNQLSLVDYPSYVGLDVSPTAIELCKHKFKEDSTKRFNLYCDKAFESSTPPLRADMALSIDVLFHLVENDVFHEYMTNLFDAATRYVVIYSSNLETPTNYHEKHRNFEPWVADNRHEWHLARTIENGYPYDPNDPDDTSRSDFYLFEKA